MAIEKKIVVRPASVAIVDGELDPTVLQAWTNGLNVLSDWSIASVVVAGGGPVVIAGRPWAGRVLADNEEKAGPRR